MRIRNLLPLVFLVSLCCGVSDSAFGQAGLPGAALPGMPVGGPFQNGGLGFGVGPGSVAIGSAGSGYAQGDSVTLSCPGVTFSTAPVVAVNQVNTGVVTGVTLVNPGVASTVNGQSCTLTQASTSGSGSGLTVTGTFGPLGSFLSFAGLSTGGGVTNGNLFLGAETPASTMGGAENTFVGDRAGGAFTGAVTANTAFGHDACGIYGSVAPTGSYNTCVGNDAGRNISGTAASNTLVGQTAGGSNAISMSGSGNTDVGQAAGLYNGAANNNTIVGAYAANNTTGPGGSNAIFGNSGCQKCTGGRNVTIGQGVASTTLTSGTGNILVGTSSSVDTPSSSTSNLINIGNTIFGGNGGTLPATVTISAGEVGLGKITASGTAPGAGVAKLAIVAGTNAGTCKLIMYAGTSTTPTTIIDNVGGGC